MTLEALFSPKAVALVGASGRANNPFARPLKYLVDSGYQGHIFPVNSQYTELAGMKCYASLSALPEPIDLALLLIPADATVAVLPEVAAAGASAAIAFASGFAEVGPQGVRLQEALVREAQHLNVRILGPNCQGFVHVPSRLAATFTAGVEQGLPDGDSGVAYIGQSGAVGGSILDITRERGLGLVSWASTGNEADLGTLDLAEVLVEDPDVQVLAMYFEQLPNGARFIRFARRARDLQKSVVVLRSGISTSGQRAAASHTGALMAPAAGFVAAADELDVIVVEGIDEFLDVICYLSSTKRPKGRRVGIVTTSGGAGSLAADCAERRGFDVPLLSSATQSVLGEVIPAFGATANPVDVTAQLFNPASQVSLGDVVRLVQDDPAVDLILLIMTMVTGDLAKDVALDLVRAFETSETPCSLVWIAGEQSTQLGRDVLRLAGQPIYDSIDDALKTSALVIERPSDISTAPIPELANEVIARIRQSISGLTTLTEFRASELLDALGIERPTGLLARRGEEAIRYADQLGGTVVAKIQSPDIVHKTDVGGVRIGVSSEDIATVFTELMALDLTGEAEGVLVQEVVGSGVELLIGVIGPKDGYPATVTVGIGGVGVEIYADVASAAAPVTRDRARQLIRSLRGAPLLEGHRGRHPRDIDAAAQVVQQLSLLASALGDQLDEAEINPLVVRGEGEGAMALDFMLRLSGVDSK